MTPTTPDSRMDARIRDSFARQSLMQGFGAEVLKVRSGQVTLRAPISELTRQQQGIAHAGLTFALGDTAAGYAALTQMPDACEVVTSELKINLLAPGTGDMLYATGRVVRVGKRLIVVTAEVSRDDGELIALLQGTMVPVPA